MIAVTSAALTSCAELYSRTQQIRVGMSDRFFNLFDYVLCRMSVEQNKLTAPLVMH